MTAVSPILDRKVVVHLRATGDAPILKQAKFKIAGSDRFSKVIEFLRHQLHRDTLFVFVNSAFSPNPDELVIDLYNLCMSAERAPSAGEVSIQHSGGVWQRHHSALNGLCPVRNPIHPAQAVHPSAIRSAQRWL